MPTDATGDRTATLAPSPAPGDNVSPIVRLPNDGEPANVASIWQALKNSNNFIDWLTHHGLWRDIAKTVTALITFSVAGDDNADVEFSGSISVTYKLALRFALGGGRYFRIYRADDSWVLTHNAYFVSGGSQWHRDAAGDSLFASFSDGGLYLGNHFAGDPNPWSNTFTALGSGTDWQTILSSSSMSLETSGRLKIDASASPASATPQAVIPRGNILKESVSYGWATCGGTTLTAGLNVYSFSKPGAGHYTLQFNGLPPNDYFAKLSVDFPQTGNTFAVYSVHMSANSFNQRTIVDVYTAVITIAAANNVSQSATDMPFFVELTGG